MPFICLPLLYNYIHRPLDYRFMVLYIKVRSDDVADRRGECLHKTTI